MKVFFSRIMHEEQTMNTFFFGGGVTMLTLLCQKSGLAALTKILQNPHVESGSPDLRRGGISVAGT